MTSVSDHQLAATLAAIAVDIQAQRNTNGTLTAIAEAATHTVPGASWAGISVIRGKSIAGEVPTDEVAAKVDRLQTDLGEGPAFTLLEDKDPSLHVPDLATDARFPRFRDGAVALGVRAVLSFRLIVRRGDLGVLNLYGNQPHCFGDESILTGEMLAQHAAVAMAGAQAEEQLQTAIASRDVIGQAKGILMQRDGLNGVQAFATLTRASQQVNLKVVEVAKWFVKEHEEKLVADERIAPR